MSKFIQLLETFSIRPFIQPNLSSNGTLWGSSFAVSSNAWRGSAFTVSDGVGFIFGDCLRGNSGWYIIMSNPSALLLKGFTYTNGYADAVSSGVTVYGSNNNGATWQLIGSATGIQGGAGVSWYSPLTSLIAYKGIMFVMSSVASSDCAELRLNALQL